MNFSAIVHTGTDNFCYPVNDHELMINIKTGYDIREVFVIYGDPFDGTVTESGWKWSRTRAAMTEKKELAHHFWYSEKITLPFGRCKYYFELHGTSSDTDTTVPCGTAAEEIRFYLEDGFYTAEELSRISGNLPCFTQPWMNAADCLNIPDWVSRTIWYQIFPDRFCKVQPCTTDQLCAEKKALDTMLPKESGTEPSNRCMPWANADCIVSNHDRYGGNLQGIIGKLGYLADLGINGLYLNPINASPSVHKYDTTDYLTVDSAFGTPEDLRQLVQEAHRHGMKVMLDGVFNHCGWNFAPWQDVVQNGRASPYWDWFMVNNWPIELVYEKDSEGRIRYCPSGTNGKNGVFKTFAYIDRMPKLNTNNPEVISYLLSVCSTWLQEYDIDGLRLDVANELSHRFCRELRERMRSLKSDFYILGEIWHNAMPWLRGNELDSVMNYPFAQALWKFFTDTKQTARSLEHELNAVFTLYPDFLNTGLFNLLDSHDTMRIFTRTGGNADAVYQQYAVLLTLPGSPCIYYGSEVLLTGGEDPDNRRCMPWAGIAAGTYEEPLTVMKHLIALRHRHPAMTANSYQFIYESGDKAADRIVHIRKSAAQSLNKNVQPLSIDVILNCTAAPVSVAHLVTGTANIHLSHRYSEGLLQPGGFLFFD